MSLGEVEASLSARGGAGVVKGEPVSMRSVERRRSAVFTPAGFYSTAASSALPLPTSAAPLRLSMAVRPF